MITPNLVLVLHCRSRRGSSGEEVHLQLLSIFKDRPREQRIQLQCFSGSPVVFDWRRKKFPNTSFSVNRRVQNFTGEAIKALKMLGTKQLLLETDAPYFARQSESTIFRSEGTVRCSRDSGSSQRDDPRRDTAQHIIQRAAVLQSSLMSLTRATKQTGESWKVSHSHIFCCNQTDQPRWVNWLGFYFWRKVNHGVKKPRVWEVSWPRGLWLVIGKLLK